MCCWCILQVHEVDSWAEGPIQCHQFDIQVTNTGTTPANAMTLTIEAVGELQKCWNCVQKSSVNGMWCFDLPGWCPQNGGLQVGDSVVVGLIVKGTELGAVALA